VVPAFDIAVAMLRFPIPARGNKTLLISFAIVTIQERKLYHMRFITRNHRATKLTGAGNNSTLQKPKHVRCRRVCETGNLLKSDRQRPVATLQGRCSEFATKHFLVIARSVIPSHVRHAMRSKAVIVRMERQL